MSDASWSNRACALLLKEAEGKQDKIGECKQIEEEREFFSNKKKFNNKWWESCQLLGTLREGLTAG